MPSDRFVETERQTCCVAIAPIRQAPKPDAERRTELLFGEAFDVLKAAGGWSFGQAARDGYIGYVRAEALQPPGPPPTHWVSAPSTIGFRRPDIKSPAVGFWSLNSLVAISGEEGSFLDAGAAGFLRYEHVTSVGLGAEDPVALAADFVGAPYLWGGRGARGLDCSGLVQQALLAAGKACPRDADMQMMAFPSIEAEEARRGDLVFWTDHVALVVGPDQIIHANAHHMAVRVERLQDAIARIRAAGAGEPIGFRRPG